MRLALSIPVLLGFVNEDYGDTMATATFRFYEELNEFLPRHRKKTDFEACIAGNGTIEDTIVSLGVPPGKVDLILVNGRSVDFTYMVCPGDRFSVYPVFESLNVQHVSRLRKAPLRRPKFIVDCNLGDLAMVMGSLGFDVFFDPSLSCHRIKEISKKEKRTIITESKHFRDLGEVTHLVQVSIGPIERQIREVIGLLDLGENV